MTRLLLLALLLGATAAAAGDPRLPGSAFMGPALRAMSQDDSANPAELSVLDGQALWRTPVDAAHPACAACHGDPAQTMPDIAARYPAFDAVSGKAVDLPQRIALCRFRQQGLDDWPAESEALLSLAAYLSQSGRGLPIAPVSDPRLHPFLEQGAALYRQRAGQLQLSCEDCHDHAWGRSLGGATIPQAHPTGYPIYRLEWQAVGSLQRRLRNCLAGMRAEVPAYDSPLLVALELFLRQRAAGMAMDAPAVRP